MRSSHFFCWGQMRGPARACVFSVCSAVAFRCSPPFLAPLRLSEDYGKHHVHNLSDWREEPRKSRGVHVALPGHYLMELDTQSACEDSSPKHYLFTGYCLSSIQLERPEVRLLSLTLRSGLR